jgi:hypothetical protein
MADFEHKTQIFLEACNQGPYDFEGIEGIDDFLVECLKMAGFNKGQKTIVVKESDSSTTAAPKTKKLTGYNLFMRAKMAELKEAEVPSTQRMTEVSKAWKALTEADKEMWKKKAAEEAPVEVAVKAKGGKKGPKTLTGYQLFVRETMPLIKADDTIEPKARLAQIGKMWKALEATEQEAYKQKAAEMS